VIKLATLSRASVYPGSLSKRFQYADDGERQYVVKTAKFSTRQKTRIHLLSDTSGNDYGFVALSISSFDQSYNRPSIVIDYIFTSHQYRGRKFPELDNTTVFEYLFEFTLRSALSLQEIVPLRFIALQPAHDRLAAYYQRIGFSFIDTSGWMFMKL